MSIPFTRSKITVLDGLGSGNRTSGRRRCCCNLGIATSEATSSLATLFGGGVALGPGARARLSRIDELFFDKWHCYNIYSATGREEMSQ